MKERFIRFMQGRYGVDSFNRFLFGLIFGLLFLNIFVKSTIVNLLTLLLIFFLYFRMFSRNYEKRYQENTWFLRATAPVTSFFKKQKSHASQRKNYRLFKCPDCKQMVRVPKGKGKIEIRCPKCGRTFIKRS